ncbi:MAG: nucleoside deaminase [Bacteroidales bacterium]|nr:nucleoside deaminase [Bacteroidales bacterium]
MMVFTDEYYMREALKEARKALDLDEVPVGAVIVCYDRIIARGHNLTERLNDVTAHAEMQAFTSAANYLGAKYLEECTLYVTLEPCVMCAGAAFWTQIDRVVYGAADDKRGYTKTNAPLLHPRTKVVPGILEAECADLLIEFFKSKRQDATE